jgi:hypothetical protein
MHAPMMEVRFLKKILRIFPRKLGGFIPVPISRKPI